MKNEIDYTDALHKRENNPESEKHLKANKFHFTGQVAFVYTLLQQGRVLTQRSAMIQHNIGDCHRRIGNLRDALKKAEIDFKIVDEWVMNERGDKTRFKKWYNPEAAGIRPHHTIYDSIQREIIDISPIPKKEPKSKRIDTTHVENMFS